MREEIEARLARMEAVRDYPWNTDEGSPGLLPAVFDTHRHAPTDLRHLLDALAAAEAALKEIAEHPAQVLDPNQIYEGDWLMAYRDGVRDGHRCAANIARAALSAEPTP